MKPARMALFLQLCLLAGLAAAQTPEQEIQAEAKKLLSSLFSKCGEDYFSKRIFKRKKSTAWIIGQYKDLTASTQSAPLSKADSLNGVQWKGAIRFTSSAGRTFPHDTDIPQHSAAYRTLDKWSDWKNSDLPATYFYSIEKRNGETTLPRKPPMEITPVKCNEVPPG